MTGSTRPDADHRHQLTGRGALARAVAVVEGFVPFDAVQARHRATILDFCARHPDALERDPAGHLTASALVASADGRRLLVLWHRKLERWLQPGGHADGEPDLPFAALGEATEETGIAELALVTPAVDVDVHEVAPPGETRHLHLDVRFVVVAPPGAEPVANAEADRFRWVTESELPAVGADQSLRRLARLGMPVARRTLTR